MRAALAVCSALLVVAVANCFPQEPQMPIEGGSSMQAQPQKRQLALWGIDSLGYRTMGYPVVGGVSYIYRKRRDAPEEPIADAEHERVKRQYWSGFVYPSYINTAPYVRYY